jgi:drug/metabolite transporter (DMT)-like permease
MIAAPEYYALPALCAVVAWLLGRRVNVSVTPTMALAGVITVIAVATGIEVVWHESHVLASVPIRGILAIGIGFVLPTLVSFFACWFASSRRVAKSMWAAAAVLVAVASVGTYPMCAIYSYCLIVQDCL